MATRKRPSVPSFDLKEVKVKHERQCWGGSNGRVLDDIFQSPGFESYEEQDLVCGSFPLNNNRTFGAA